MPDIYVIPGALESWLWAGLCAVALVVALWYGREPK